MPRYGEHKPTGQAVVYLTCAETGRRHAIYLGRHGTPQSREAYNREVAAWYSNNQRVRSKAERDAERAKLAGSESTTVAQLIDAYAAHARRKFTSGDLESSLVACRLVKEHYGSAAADSIGPNALRVLRTKLENRQWEGRVWSRKYINRQMRRIISIWKWGVSHEMVKEETWRTMATLEHLQRGMTDAHERDEVGPASVDSVVAVLPYVVAPVRDMIRIQLLTGMRATEVMRLKWEDIDESADPDTDGETWVWRAPYHKNSHRNEGKVYEQHGRVAGIGPQAREILETYRHREPSAYIFSPLDATDRLGRPLNRAKHDSYTRSAYGLAVRRACREAIAKGANIVPFTPRQLRKTNTDNMSKLFDPIVVGNALGHSNAEMTINVYMSTQEEHARRVAKAAG